MRDAVDMEPLYQKVEQISHDIEAVHKDVTSIKKLLNGNGTPERGIVVRLDRVEQTSKNIKRGLWAISAGVVAALANLFTR